MEPFAKGIPRLAVLATSIAILSLLPPRALERGPDLCLWSHLFHMARCPACGSTRALSALFHGQFGQALAYNHNVLVTGPVLLLLFISDLWKLGLSIRFAAIKHSP
ncbi:MAG TPA: DUF2752 domain-containing protein [Terriglobia bacterium]|nr:DUF2752 domain-containing protein [Terriglobia bacterium]